MRSIDYGTVTIQEMTTGKLPRLPFALMKEGVLGKNYDLSLVFVSESKSKELNRTYRKKNKPANVLSFPYSKKEGEIFICVPVLKSNVLITAALGRILWDF